MFDLADGDAFEGVVAIDRSGYPVWYYNAFEQVMAEWNGMEWNIMEWNGMEWNGMEWNGLSRLVLQRLRATVVTCDITCNVMLRTTPGLVLRVRFATS